MRPRNAKLPTPSLPFVPRLAFKTDYKSPAIVVFGLIIVNARREKRFAATTR
jgi:hypothetical protein